MDQKLATRIICEVLFEKSSEDLDELMLDLQINDEPLVRFCEQFDLGNWFYDQMTLLDIDIVDEVSVIADEHRRAEQDELQEIEILHRGLQSQGTL
ncbi:hypothetical protein FBF26_01600 [Candidatus Saccharibacteria bacterium oral taxon 488]|nr:hypothetical protein FBF26_01600 [Candidatus Saccharibacteria bacterium oral taxon 488]